MYYWDGQHWVSTLAPDGRHRWTGTEWVPVERVPYLAPSQPRPSLREPTSWTRPLQIAIATRYAVAAIYPLVAPFWMSGYVSQVMQQSIRRQQQTYPSGEPPPPAFADMMTSIMTASLWFSAVLGVGLAVFVIVATIKRWAWAYYVVLVLVGFSLLGVVYSSVDLATGGALGRTQGVQPPMWSRIYTLGLGVVDVGLFAWMLIALVRRGPWAMRRTAW
jgi:hypothetical protein